MRIRYRTSERIQGLIILALYAGMLVFATLPFLRIDTPAHKLVLSVAYSIRAALTESLSGFNSR